MGAAGVDDGGVRSVLAWLLHWLVSVVHSLSLKSPSSEPVFEVFKGFKALSTADDLRGVIATEESVGGLAHILGGDAETNHGSVDDAVVLQRPQIVQLLLFPVFVWRQTQNTVGVVAQTLRFVQSQELEKGAFIAFQLHLELHVAHGTDSLEGAEWVDAGVVLPNETLELSRSISELGGGLGEDLLGVGLVHVVGLGLAPFVHLVPLDKSTIEWVVFLEFIVARSVVVAQHTRDRQVLRACIEHDLGRLTNRRAHIHSSEVNCIISAIQGHLQLQIVLIVDRKLGSLAEELLDVHARAAGVDRELVVLR